MTERGPMYWRPDALGITPSRYLVELESKITKSDFTQDRNKRQNQARDQGMDHWVSRFYYVVPYDMKHWALENLPTWAGLLTTYSADFNEVLQMVQKAPRNKQAKRLSTRCWRRCVTMQANQVVGMTDWLLKNREETLRQELKDARAGWARDSRKLRALEDRHYKLKLEVTKLRGTHESHD